MDKFTRLDAIACPLALANVDTDQLIPARFMSRSRAQGYGGFLLADVRAGGQFVLDQPRYAGAQVLVAGRNFGTGSSREAAVYALWDFGIRCVIAPSFGDIFAGNATKNGLLTATVSEADAQALLTHLVTPAPPRLIVDLDMRTITGGATVVSFAIDPVRRAQLLNGWDDIDLTMEHGAAITDYKEARLAAAPWAMRPGS
jgi:3-isopropylmalate/(R)-2-methylmalate dehydratase small subunit